jgi:uncharacterized membrane-anchored protein YitT (DUF2179 family)
MNNPWKEIDLADYENHMKLDNVMQLQTMNSMMKSTRNAVEVKIITNQPEQFKHDILVNLKHGGTAIKCTGMYTDDDKTMIVTLINIRQMKELMDMARNHPNSFVYFSDVNGVWGNFRWRSTDEVK